MSNLWPDDLAHEIEPAPVAILRHQAAKLAERTDNLVEATVRFDSERKVRELIFWHRLRTIDFPREFVYWFFISVPALNYYTEFLFYSFYGSEGYPAGFNVPDGLSEDYVHQLDRFRLGKGYKYDGKPDPYLSATEEEFRNQVRNLGIKDYMLGLEYMQRPENYIYVAKDREEFVTILGAILQAPKTRNLVRDLMRQASDLGSDISDLW